MNNILDLINRIKKGDEQAEVEILKMLKPKIKKEISTVSVEDKKDLEQEINMKILEKTRKFDTHNTPSFIDIIKKEK